LEEKIMSQIKITLVKSTIGAIPKHRQVIKALGLGKLNSSVVQKDNEATQGQIRLVRHLVKTEEIL